MRGGVRSLLLHEELAVGGLSCGRDLDTGVLAVVVNRGGKLTILVEHGIGVPIECATVIGRFGGLLRTIVGTVMLLGMMRRSR